MSEANRALVERFYDEVISGGKLDVLDELMTPDYVEHGAPLPPGPDGFKQFAAMLRGAFPDFRWTVDDWIVAGDMVVTRGHGEGTHQGEFMGAPPTGRRAGWTAIHIFRLQDGRLAERWAEADIGGLLARLRSPQSGS